MDKQGVFPHRPFSCSGRFEASRGLGRPSLAGLGLEKSGSEVDLGRRGGRSCHRVVKLLETKASECSKNLGFLKKNHRLILEFSFPIGILGFVSASPTSAPAGPPWMAMVYNPYSLDSNPLFNGMGTVGCH